MVIISHKENRRLLSTNPKIQKGCGLGCFKDGIFISIDENELIVSNENDFDDDFEFGADHP